ncbi:ADP-ribose pyrophosphatase [Gordonia effusa NBRC 100432]|uniref:ADP-ribose pyrophosphatase n=1 Tax=Gordonia effusa NBRC 100432 TaxID=1077974 RepID=H0R4U1_9ACTN|nr:NUDIX hydrolase [Gordonia effusa]GAB20092.1 ADP-ribose pyrophosphatase [Gordonia effusa NBRC 100432]
MSSTDEGGASTAAGAHDFDVASSETIYDGAIVALRVDDVVMPGGRTAKREVVEHHGAVAVVAVDDAGRVAMIRQYRHPVGRRLLELPAGLLDGGPDETALVAAQRELAEEVDLAADDWAVLADLVLSPGFCDEALRVYLARGLHELPEAKRHDEEADLALEWVDLDTATRMIGTGEIVNATAVAGILAAAAAIADPTLLRGNDSEWVDEPTAFTRRRDARN